MTWQVLYVVYDLHASFIIETIGYPFRSIIFARNYKNYVRNFSARFQASDKTQKGIFLSTLQSARGREMYLSISFYTYLKKKKKALRNIQIRYLDQRCILLFDSYRTGFFPKSQKKKNKSTRNIRKKANHFTFLSSFLSELFCNQVRPSYLYELCTDVITSESFFFLRFQNYQHIYSFFYRKKKTRLWSHRREFGVRFAFGHVVILTDRVLILTVVLWRKSNRIILFCLIVFIFSPRFKLSTDSDVRKSRKSMRTRLLICSASIRNDIIANDEQKHTIE